jgi:hypothetical protein
MRTLKHRGPRAALMATGITLVAVLTVVAAPAEAATPGNGQLTASGANPAVAPSLTAIDGERSRAGEKPVSLPALKARSAAQIARRQASLTARLTLVTNGSPALTPTDRAALITMIKNDQAGLAALGTKIAADTDLATARADHQQIFAGYRVYALLLPQIRLVRANDALINIALPRMTDAQARLQSALDKTGKAEEAAARMADLQVQIDTIRSKTSGLSAQVLAFTPAQWNADHTVLTPARQSLEASRAAIRKARADIVAVRALLTQP